MKNKLTLPLFCTAALFAFSAHSEAVSITIGHLASPARILGTIEPGVPANETNDVAMINYLLTQTSDGSGTTNGHNFSGVLTVADNPDDSGIEFYTLVSGAGVPDPAPLATLTGFATGTVGSVFTLTSSYAWLHGKWGSDAMVFYIGDLAIGTEITVSPTGFNGNGLSGFNLYSPGTSRVPDGGSSLLMLGSVLLGSASLRKYLARKG